MGSQQLNYIFIIFVTCLSILKEPKLLANNSNQEPNRPLLIEPSQSPEGQNQTQTQIYLWLEIIRQHKNELTQKELALIESKIADSYLQIGRYSAAVKHWRSAIEIARADQDNQLLAANLSDIAQAYLSLGQTLLATKKLHEAIEIAQQEQLSNILYSSYLTLGKIHQLQGKYTEAEINLNISFKYTSHREETIAVHHNLSQVFEAQSQKLRKRSQNMAAEELDTKEIETRAISYWEKAWSNANRAIELSENIESLVVVDALLQLVKVSNGKQNFNQDFYLQKAEIILSALPPSIRKVYALINLSQFQPNPVATLMEATEIAQHLKDNRSGSFAHGRLGAYYEQSQQYHEALLWTNKAILAAAQANIPQSLYQWYWQKGRIYTAQGQTETAISHYNQAITSLQKIRGELARSTDEQLDFSRNIEPVYRELLQLLLDFPTKQRIEQALEIRDLLQLSELENFFGDDCLELLSGQDKLLPSKYGLIYTIILPEATHVIFKQGQQSTSVKIDITQSQLEALVKQWRYSLEDLTEEKYWSLSRKMYDLLIQPIKSELKILPPDTLIFINDGILKNVPMAALYDGQKFLVEEYSLSISLSLNLGIRDNKPLLPKTNLLAFGLSEQTVHGPALPYVKQEIQLISEFIEVEQFIDSEFTPDTVEKELVNDNFLLIHFATHSNFGGTFEDSFLTTYQGLVNLRDLTRILNQRQIKFPDNPIYLLVLSACETAAGNKRTTLGLAGVAIRSGVQNVIGSLWSVNDQASVYLIEKLYQSLISEGLSPDAALRQAQIKMIREGIFHPALWSSLISITRTPDTK